MVTEAPSMGVTPSELDTVPSMTCANSAGVAASSAYQNFIAIMDKISRTCVKLAFHDHRKDQLPGLAQQLPDFERRSGSRHHVRHWAAHHALRFRGRPELLQGV